MTAATMACAVEQYESREAWLAARRTGLGGSDVPAVLGLSRYRSRTPLAVWADKLGLGDDSADSYWLRRGSHMESFIAAELAREVAEIELERLFGATEYVIARHPENPLLAYSPDAIVRDDSGLALGEWKSQLRGGSDWNDEVPGDVRTQVQHGMHVMDLPRAYVAVDLGHEMRWARVERDPGYERDVVPALLAWWERHVATGTAPEPGADDAATLAAIYPEDRDEAVALDVDFLDVATRIEQLTAEIKDRECEVKTLKNRVKAEMGEATRAVLVDGSGWTWRTVQRRGYSVQPTSYRNFQRAKAPR